MNILFISGEVSGDLYASHLIKAVSATDAMINTYGIGGEQVQKTAKHFIFESAQHHHISMKFMLFHNSFKKRLLAVIKKSVTDYAFDKVIIVDFHLLNEPIARLFQKQQIPIYTFITPNFWMWKNKRKANKIACYSKKIFCIYEEEYEFYQQFHSNVYYFGHPLTTITKRLPKIKSSQFRLTFFPGSRDQEFKLYFDAMLRSIKIIRKNIKNVHITISISSINFKGKIQDYLMCHDLTNVELSEASASELFQQTDCLVTAAGSATLEGIISKTPMIILAALPPLTYFVAKFILRIQMPFISLPNYIAKKEIVPELVQKSICEHNIAKQVQLVYENQVAQHKNYEFVMNKITKYTNIFQRVASEVLDT